MSKAAEIDRAASTTKGSMVPKVSVLRANDVREAWPLSVTPRVIGRHSHWAKPVREAAGSLRFSGERSAMQFAWQAGGTGATAGPANYTVRKRKLSAYWKHGQRPTSR